MAIDRETALEMLEAVAKINKLLDDCPHGTAKKIKGVLATIELVAEDAFPGGYACNCISCERPIGHDEAVRLGDEKCCPDCWEKYKADIAACSHEYKDDTDEHGEPGQWCRKCGYLAPVTASQ